MNRRALLAGVLAMPFTAQAGSRRKAQKGWRRSPTVVVYGSPEFSSLVSEAVAIWNTVCTGWLRLKLGATRDVDDFPTYSTTPRGEIAIREAPALGWALLRREGGAIISVLIASDAHRGILVHEIGHALGLTHRGDEASVMHGYVIDGQREYPTQRDIAPLRRLGYFKEKRPRNRQRRS